ncbi:hypothetical protein NUU61_006835 [Penicillium alfredii]|uniref:Uncharacterized protein n=1 Tax=Penicillium alfredii TaxID=1506179 RepID=A0A9W9K402_9EURO|nr:uncharacterized protein NUU61_006835 [Penicillium alfredii]KAJ5091965.1 hypothetical protein NUU61_006835 [Penicillium alfredii]
MCIYTYHHYPACGHMSNWSVTSCLEYTNTLRLLAGTNQTVSCKDIETSHDLLPSTQPNLCVQCEYEWSEAVVQNDPQALTTPKFFLTIEGLGAKSPLIELDARMTIDVRNPTARQTQTHTTAQVTDDDQCDIFADLSRSTSNSSSRRRRCRRRCSCCDTRRDVRRDAHRNAQPSTSRVSTNRATQTDQEEEVSCTGDETIIQFSDLLTQCFDEDEEEASRPASGKELDTTYRGFDDLIADIYQALAEGFTPSLSTDCSRVASRGSASSEHTGHSNDNFHPSGEMEDLSLDLSRDLPGETADHPNMKDSGTWFPHLSDESSPEFMSYSAYDWIPNLGVAPTFIEDEHQVEDEDSESEILTTAPSSPNGSESAAVRVLKPVTERLGTPYSRPYPVFRGFITAHSEEEAEKLGMMMPRRIHSLYASHYI